MITIVENTKSDQNFQVILDKSVTVIEFFTFCNKSNTTQIFQMCIYQSNALILYKPFVCFCFFQDYDPPSEGQVIRAPRHPAHHDPILSLLARMERGFVSQSQQPEVSHDSSEAVWFTKDVQFKNKSFFSTAVFNYLILKINLKFANYLLWIYAGSMMLVMFNINQVFSDFLKNIKTFLYFYVWRPIHTGKRTLRINTI